MKLFLTALALFKSLTLPTLSRANEAKSVFQSLGACERKFLQNFLKVDGYYKSSIDSLWGKGTEKAIVKFANGRSVTNIVKCLGKCLPGGARLFNSCSLTPKMSYRLKSCHYIANINFTAAYTGCRNELSNIDYTDKELRSWNDIVIVFVKCMELKGQLRVEKRCTIKFLTRLVS